MLYRISVLALFSLALTGCQCCSWTESYCDAIDDFSDNHKICLDEYYDATCDLNRIGKPDWCQSETNRELCGLACGCGKCNGH